MRNIIVQFLRSARRTERSFPERPSISRNAVNANEVEIEFARSLTYIFGMS